MSDSLLQDMIIYYLKRASALVKEMPGDTEEAFYTIVEEWKADIYYEYDLEAILNSLIEGLERKEVMNYGKRNS